MIKAAFYLWKAAFIVLLRPPPPSQVSPIRVQGREGVRKERKLKGRAPWGSPPPGVTRCPYFFMLMKMAPMTKAAPTMPSQAMLSPNRAKASTAAITGSMVQMMPTLVISRRLTPSM